MYNCASGVHPFCTYAGKALPRNKTLEQLRLTESPELELRKIRSTPPVATPENVVGGMLYIEELLIILY